MTDETVLPFLYLPMEIAAREMDSRLLIAIFAANAGMDVILGQKWLLQKNIERLPEGAWIFKTLTPGDAGPIVRAHKAGHVTTAIDEEIPGLGEGGGGLRWVSEHALRDCDTLFCLGEAHSEAMENKFPQYRDAYVITGNPRWDMLRAELQELYALSANEIKQNLGRFILINTNVGLMNSAKGSPEKLLAASYRDGRIDMSLEEDRQFVKDGREFDIANLEASISIAKKLAAAFPDLTIVLRPHPTENINTYRQALIGIGNITILTGGPAAPWVLASELLVHTSCTTGVEAFALNKPSISFESIPSPRLTYFLSSNLSRCTSAEDNIVNWTKNLLDGRIESAWRTPSMLSVFHRFFAGQSDKFAAELIVDHILSRVVTNSNPKAGWKPARNLKTWNWRSGFQKRMFPDVKADELQERIRVLSSLIGKPAPEIKRVGRALYHLKPVKV